MKKPLSILVVDCSDCLTGLSLLLEGMGHRVVVAATGNEALLLVEREKPQIVVADLQMPDLDGMVFLKTLESRDPYITTIVISGEDNPDRVQEAMRRGAWDYLVKPVLRDELEESVEGAIERASLLLANSDSREELAGKKTVVEDQEDS